MRASLGKFGIMFHNMFCVMFVYFVIIRDYIHILHGAEVVFSEHSSDVSLE